MQCPPSWSERRSPSPSLQRPDTRVTTSDHEPRPHGRATQRTRSAVQVTKRLHTSRHRQGRGRLRLRGVNTRALPLASARAQLPALAQERPARERRGVRRGVTTSRRRPEPRGVHLGLLLSRRTWHMRRTPLPTWVECGMWFWLLVRGRGCLQHFSLVIYCDLVRTAHCQPACRDRKGERWQGGKVNGAHRCVRTGHYPDQDQRHCYRPPPLCLLKSSRII